MRFLATPLVLAALSAVAQAAPNVAPAKFVRQVTPVPGSYIVVLKAPQVAPDPIDTMIDTTTHATTHATIDRLATRHGASINRRYTTALHGFAARMSEADARALAEDPAVDHVEEDGLVHGDGTQRQPGWGLDRLDQPTLPLDFSYAQISQGAGATVYVIDSGIHSTHAEFAGRLLPGASFVADALGTADCSGHGSHVAGTIGGLTFGVAKQVHLVPVRVLDCNASGSISNIIAGLDWVAANHLPGAIANLSIGSGISDAEDAAVRRLIASGVAVIVSAGNHNTDACTQSPARTPEAITVAATTVSDTRGELSNFGTCVDVHAPGVAILSAGIANDTATQVMSGTSMAAPHVTGVAALYLAANPRATPAQIAEALLDHAIPDTIIDTQGSPNLMLNSSFIDLMAPAPDDDTDDALTEAASDELGGCQVGGGGAGILVALALIGGCRARRHHCA